jgi:protein-tyrosine phosphatase
MIDLHCHILPGLDDGSSSLDESLEMARMAVGDGIRVIVASSHFTRDYRDRPEEIIEAARDLQEAIDRSRIPLELVPGAEILFDADLPRLVEDDKLIYIGRNRRFILLELPPQFIPPGFLEFCFSLKLKGITPILTHPERNLGFQALPEKLFEVVEKGIPIQITAGSLLGSFGPEARRLARFIIERRLAHAIASDAHDFHSRPPKLSGAVAEAKGFAGADYIDSLVRDFPQKFIRGETFDLPEPVYETRAPTLWRRLLGVKK